MKQITEPLYEISSSVSKGSIGSEYGETLGRAAKWEGFAEESVTRSWEKEMASYWLIAVSLQQACEKHFKNKIWKQL